MTPVHYMADYWRGVDKTRYKSPLTHSTWQLCFTSRQAPRDTLYTPTQPQAHSNRATHQEDLEVLYDSLCVHSEDVGVDHSGAVSHEVAAGAGSSNVKHTAATNTLEVWTHPSKAPMDSSLLMASSLGMAPWYQAKANRASRSGLPPCPAG